MDISASELAKKQKYYDLLSKVKAGTTLTSAEIRALEDLEKVMAKPKKNIPSRMPVKKNKVSRKKGRGRKRKLPVDLALIKSLAIESGGIIEGNKRLKEHDLVSLVDKFPEISEAWQRGLFLKNLADLAASAATISEAENMLGLGYGELVKMIDSDIEVSETWNQTRLDIVIAIKTAMVDKAKEGRPLAAKQIESMFREVTSAKADLYHIPIEQMCDMCRISRQTLHDWYSNKGLIRNSDKSFNMKNFLPWFENFVLEKNKLKATMPQGDYLRDLKAKKLQADIDAQRGQLLDRGSILAGLLARQQALVNSFMRKPEDLAMLCHGQPSEKIIKILNSFFDDVRRNQCQVPDELLLPEDIKKQFEKIMTKLNPEGE